MILVFSTCCFPSPAQPSILPQEPLVEIGGSIQLNCSWDCPDGKVQWKGLDTSLGNIISTPTYSLLLVTNATVAVEGTKICVGNCQRKNFQASVNLPVYSFPDTLQLDTQPTELVAGQPAHLRCSVSKVYPPGSLTLSWYQGGQRLETPEPEEVSEDEELFSYHSELEVPGEKVTEGQEFRCEVKLLLPSERSFQRARAVTVNTKAVAMEPTTESVTGQEHPTTKSVAPSESPTAGRVAPELTAAESSPVTLTVTSCKPSPKSTSAHRLATTETLTTDPTTTLRPPSTGAATRHWNLHHNLSSAVESPTPLGVASTESPPPKKTTSGWSPSPESVCSLRIRRVPPTGTTGEPLQIICEAECSDRVTIRWVQTPVALSQYREEVSEGKSTLTVDRVGLHYQGVYECVMLSRRAQTARLHVTVSAATFSTDLAIAIGTAGSLLGLIVTAFASRHLWRRLQALGMKSPMGNVV
ncbi:mucosal addressin cell adhesion molecule 1 isoform X2 [Carettochelys insculpta]|uniref:mucosal addressin cell adhesion molecule 1 isoform X2 n=1 Tax=Carettochelys insculpta TaxID=44489 RepID=UPI003EB9CA60